MILGILQRRRTNKQANQNKPFYIEKKKRQRNTKNESEGEWMNKMDQDCVNGYVQCGKDSDNQATEEARREDLIGGCIDSQSRVSKLVRLGDRKFYFF